MIVDLEKVKAFAEVGNAAYHGPSEYVWEMWMQDHAKDSLAHLEALVANVESLRRQSGDVVKKLWAAQESFYALREEYEELEKENKRLAEIEWMYKDLCR